MRLAECFSLFCFLCLFNFSSRALRGSYEDFLIPDYSEFYYYRNLHEKLSETMSINNCSVTGDISAAFEPQLGDKADFSIQLINPPTSVTRKWGTERNELYAIPKLFIKVTRNLCTSKAFSFYKRGQFKNSKGCLKMFQINSSGARVKVIKRYGATLHPEHIRCITKESARICIPASEGFTQLPQQYRSLNSYPFLITAHNVIVAKSGE
jgi:hypothetical protein